MKKNQVIGILIFVFLILAIIIGKVIKDNKSKQQEVDGENIAGLTTVYVAAGGGKEDFLADEDVKRIMQEKYKLNVVYDTWSNGKTVLWPLIREAVGKGDAEIAEKLQAELSAKQNPSYTINSEGVSKYDALFTSDQRFYDYYKVRADKSKGEADRYTVLDGGLTLNTPIVIYSWAGVVEALQKQNIVTEENGVYYISDMDKMLAVILNGNTWKELGLDKLYGNINIASTDPVTSSPGATYYGLLLSIMCQSNVTTQNVETNLPKLRQFYIKSGYMNNTPADLFKRYLMTGMGGQPMIVDYEKSMIDFAKSEPTKFEQVKKDIRVLYPTPTIWNSHCIATFTENGNAFYKAFEDPEIQQIAWEKYGFRTGVTGGTYDVSSIGIGVPQTITSTVTSLKMDTYNRLIEYLSSSEETSN